MKPADVKSPFIWKDRHILIKDRIWYVPNHYHDHKQFSFPGWHHPLTFENNQPICLEYCSGNGAWIAERAQRESHYNWVAIEQQFIRVRKIRSKIQNFDLPNLLAACGEGFVITKEFIPAESIRKVYINFPDPWPKTRHKKHRLVQKQFIIELSRVLEPGGELTIVTDDEPYSNMVIEVMKDHGGFESIFANADFTEDYPDYGSSYFEDLWRGFGKKIRYHVFRKISPKRKEQ